MLNYIFLPLLHSLLRLLLNIPRSSELALTSVKGLIPKCSFVDMYALLLISAILHFSQQEFVRNTVKKLGLFSMAKTVNSCTTHVVAGNGRRTLNILNAIAQGCWIISPSWVRSSIN